MKTLRLHLCPLADLGADGALDYELLDEHRAIVKRGQATLGDLPRLSRVELVVAAPDVLLIEAALPPLSGARLRAALPALAEPHILSEIESAFVVAARGPGPRATLAVLDRALFARALELLRRAKLEPASATPEQLTLPLESGRWCLRLGAAYSVLRMAALRGIACSPAAGSAPVEVQLALQQAGESQRPQAIVVDGDFPAREWTDALGLPVVAPESAAEVTPTGAEPVALELLQYELAPRLASWRAWRVPAAIAALLALTWLVGLNVDAWLMRREESALRAHMEATLRGAFPSTPVVLDPLQQMRRGVADLRAGAGASDPREFLPLATAVARALPTENDAVRAMEFRDQVLRVDFDPRALDAPKKRDLVIEQISAGGLTGRFSEATLTVRAKGDGP
ncbi:MAG TPA: type II secretion system protein GspL [Burkholderiales bacterium]|nr:type II secretion system protein GspL [Burkholderiales bacterium]